MAILPFFAHVLALVSQPVLDVVEGIFAVVVMPIAERLEDIGAALMVAVVIEFAVCFGGAVQIKLATLNGLAT
jgi:hypothetical protein